MNSSIEDLYEIIVPLGSGSFGQVFKARNKMNGKIVALKKIKSIQQNEGFPRQALREIITLKNLAGLSENIISLLDVITTHPNRNVYLIFDYYELDLCSLINSSPSFSVSQVKCYMIQLLKSLNVLHSHGIIHRDIKPANIMISPDNVIKLGDFGLSRSVKSDNGKLTNRIMTQRYRPPELSLGATEYGQEVDVWSLGCTFYEMMAGKQLFKSETETEQVSMIFKLFGVPSDAEWPQWRSLPSAKLFQALKPSESNFDEFLNINLPPEFYDAKHLLKRMLTLNPSNRISISEALNDPYFLSANDEYSHYKQPTLSVPENHSQTYYEDNYFKKLKSNIKISTIYQDLRPPAILPHPILAD